MSGKSNADPYCLQSREAKEISSRFHGLTAEKILPLYLELKEELGLSSNGTDPEATIKFNMSDPHTPINTIASYAEKFACVAIINYELARRMSVELPCGNNEVCIFHRLHQPAEYIISGKNYENITNSLVNMHYEFLNSL